MAQINLSAEMIEILRDAIDDAIQYTEEIMDEEEADEFVEAATARHDKYIDADKMLVELEKLN